MSPVYARRRPSTRSHAILRAFTLIDLLVVIAIIATLSGMLLPAIAMVRKSAAKTSALNGLRQLGLSVTVYSNNNDDFLPGPLSTGITYQYYKGVAGCLGNFIWSYLDMPEPIAAWQSIPTFRDKYRERNGGVTTCNNSMSYHVRSPWFYPGGKNVANPTNDPSVSFDPCGYPTNPAANQMRPCTLGSLSHLSDVVFVQDPSSTNYPADSNLPATPFYGKYITLYYDGHVGLLDKAWSQIYTYW